MGKKPAPVEEVSEQAKTISFLAEQEDDDNNEYSAFEESTLDIGRPAVSASSKSPKATPGTSTGTKEEQELEQLRAAAEAARAAKLQGDAVGESGAKKEEGQRDD